MTNIDIEYLRLYSRIRDQGADSLEWRRQLLIGLHKHLMADRVLLLHAHTPSTGAITFQYVAAHPGIETKRRQPAATNIELDPTPFDKDEEAQSCCKSLQASNQNNHTEIITKRQGPRSYIAARIPHQPSRLIILRFDSITEATGLTQQQLDSIRPFVAILAESHATSLAPPEAPAPSRLPPKRREVFEGVLRGCSDTEIAEQVGIAHDTVRGHLKEIYNYFDAANRSVLLAQFASLARAQAKVRTPKKNRPRSKPNRHLKNLTPEQS